jgi:hypothetical protein
MPTLKNFVKHLCVVLSLMVGVMGVWCMGSFVFLWFLDPGCWRIDG